MLLGAGAPSSRSWPPAGTVWPRTGINLRREGHHRPAREVPCVPTSRIDPCHRAARLTLEPPRRRALWSVVRRPTDAVDEFLAAPAEHVLQRRRYIVALTDAGTLGIVIAGDIEAADAADIFPLLSRMPGLLGAGRRQLVDMRRVRSYAVGAMEVLVSYHQEADAYVDTVGREAVVRPDGYVGAFAAGFHRSMAFPFEGRAFATEAEAFRWLGDPEGWGELPIDEWLPVADPFVADLRRLLLREGAGLDQSTAARRLGVSRRTLRRRLDEVEGGFRGLRRSVLIDEACRLLKTTDDPIKSIAYRLGFRSPARLSEAFVRELGETPAAFRARKRAAPQ